MMWRRHGCLIAALLIAALGCGAIPSAHGADIRIWSTAVVEGDTVYLRDVADIQWGDAGSVGRLEQLVVHAAPRPGGTILIRAADVSDALTEANVNLAETRILGSSRCKVSRPRKPRTPRKSRAARRPPPRKNGPVQPPPRLGPSEHRPPSDSLEFAMREFIAGRLSYDNGSLEIRFSPASRRSLALRGPEYQFTIRSQGRRRLGLMGFEVEIRKAGAKTRRVSVAAEVLLVQDVVVARRTINQGTPISGRDVKLEERRFDRPESIGMTELSAVIGLESQRFFRPGDMLDVRSLRSKPLVRRGEAVKIILSGDGLEIRTTGRAQQEGALGEVISVRRDGAKRKQDLIEAVVAGPGLVTYRGLEQVARR